MDSSIITDNEGNKYKVLGLTEAEKSKPLKPQPYIVEKLPQGKQAAIQTAKELIADMCNGENAIQKQSPTPMITITQEEYNKFVTGLRTQLELQRRNEQNLLEQIKTLRELRERELSLREQDCLNFSKEIEKLKRQVKAYKGIANKLKGKQIYK